jgi:hypothetical protein
MPAEINWRRHIKLFQSEFQTGVPKMHDMAAANAEQKVFFPIEWWRMEPWEVL